jgi:hypothetical protein
MQKVFITIALMAAFVSVAPLANAATSTPAPAQVTAAHLIPQQGDVVGDVLADLDGLLGDLGVV